MMNRRQKSDTQLIQRYLKGDSWVFEALVHRYEQSLYSYLIRLVGDREAANDLFQDVFFKVIKTLPRYKEQNKFSNWLFSIAHNVGIDYLRKRKRIATVELNDSIEIDESVFDTAFDADNQSAEILFQRKENQQLLASAIEKLSVEQRDVILLREYSDMSFKEIAELLDCPLNTVLGRMRYALLNLRKIIEKDIQGGLSDVL